MLSRLKTFAAMAGAFFATTLFGLIGLVFSVVAPRLVIPFSVRPWGKALLASCRVKLSVRGVENIPPEPSVIMYNHQSAFDIPALVASLPGQYKLVMKDEVLGIPFVGWVSKANGHYFVARDGGSGDSKQLKLMARGIREKKQTLVLAPEGTRSETGRLLEFKKGGFLLSALTGAPVVPMVILGGREVKRKNGPLNIGRPMTVEFLAPVRPPDGASGREVMNGIERDTRDAMLSRVQKEERI